MRGGVARRCRDRGAVAKGCYREVSGEAGGRAGGREGVGSMAVALA